MKWLPYQINRKSLYTNYRVNKFKNNISPFCSFCQHVQGATQQPELVSHLFYSCNFVLRLWTEVKGWLRTFNINIPLNKNIMLFGFHNQLSNSVPIFILLCVKYFIWKSKFQTQELSFSSFNIFLKSKIEDVKNACLYEEKELKFEPCVQMYNCLNLE